MENYKIRIYYTDGVKVGCLKAEEFFNSLDELKNRYKELFKYELFSLNPTAWKFVNDEYIRITI